MLWEKLKLIFERTFPYWIPVIVIRIMWRFSINFYNSENLGDVLDACTTVIALIIGFLGAILPVMLGMKNESKFVKYVFEKDTKKLFLHYIKATIIVGLICLTSTMSLYFVDDFTEKDYGYDLFYLWVGLFIMFLLLTFRSLNNMLTLVFTPDSVLESDGGAVEEKVNEKTVKRFDKSVK